MRKPAQMKNFIIFLLFHNKGCQCDISCLAIRTICYQDLIAKNIILLKLISNSFLCTDPVHYTGLSQSAGLFLQRSKGGVGLN